MWSSNECKVTRNMIQWAGGGNATSTRAIRLAVLKGHPQLDRTAAWNFFWKVAVSYLMAAGGGQRVAATASCMRPRLHCKRCRSTANAGNELASHRPSDSLAHG